MSGFRNELEALASRCDVIVELAKKSEMNQSIRFISRPDGGELYTVLTLPKQSQASTVALFCAPTFEEHGRAYPIVRECARWLCGHGIASLRFDYLGTGDSSGDGDEFSMSSASADIDFVTSWLAQVVPNARIVPIGVRLGCRFMLDALASKLGDPSYRLGKPILWNPVLDARAHILAELRATIAGSMIVYKAAVASREDIVRETLDVGYCERDGFRLNQIDGFPVTKQLLLDVANGEANTWTFGSPASVIVQVGPGDHETLQASFRKLLPQMDWHPVMDSPYWTQPPIYRQVRTDLFKATQECIERCQ